MRCLTFAAEEDSPLPADVMLLMMAATLMSFCTAYFCCNVVDLDPDIHIPTYMIQHRIGSSNQRRHGASLQDTCRSSLPAA